MIEIAIRLSGVLALLVLAYGFGIKHGLGLSAFIICRKLTPQQRQEIIASLERGPR